MEENKTGIGSIIGAIIIIALIVLGGLYFWGKRIEESKNTQEMTSDNTQPSTQDASAQEAAAIKSMSSSDDLNSIEADLKNTQTTNLDSELNVQAQ